MYVDTSVSQGQQEARTRWGTHESGAEFDRKKRAFLTQEAREFLSQQVMCVIVGPGPEQGPRGLLLAGQPGFVETPDMYTCLIPIDRCYEMSSLVQSIHASLARGVAPQLALCFMQHVTRQRICVQGTVEILPEYYSEVIWLHMRVNLAFFHCPKYIRTRVNGLHTPPDDRSSCLNEQAEDYLSVDACTFLARQVLCYLCTVDQHGQHAVNHRGGAAGFLVTLEPDRLTPGGVVLLPDYAGNGAFEALGNILETGKATLLVPDYAEQLALCIAGEATILEPPQLPVSLREQCRGAVRIIALSVRHVERQIGNWSEALDYERARAKVLATCQHHQPRNTSPSCNRDRSAPSRMAGHRGGYRKKMTYVITQPCVGVKDASCVDVCPVDCIHPTQSEPDFETNEQLYINPDECIDCGACEPACPVTAIFEESAVPDEWKQYIKINADFFKG